MGKFWANNLPFTVQVFEGIYNYWLYVFKQLKLQNMYFYWRLCCLIQSMSFFKLEPRWRRGLLHRGTTKGIQGLWIFHPWWKGVQQYASLCVTHCRVWLSRHWWQTKGKMFVLRNYLYSTCYILLYMLRKNWMIRIEWYFYSIW